MQALVLLPEWDCQTCTDMQKISRGCVTRAKTSTFLDGERQDRCPRRPLLDQPQLYEEVFWLYGNYHRGILPEAGGLSDQPLKLMAMLRRLHNTLEASRAEKEETERRRDAIRKRTATMLGQG